MKLRYLIFIPIIFFSCGTSERSSEKRYAVPEHILKTEAYIDRGRVETSEGYSWKVVPDSASNVDYSLYSGSPGIVLFYLELFQATNDSSHLNKALEGANDILAHLEDTISYDQVGFYTGLAGMGYTLSEVHKVSKQEKYFEGVLKTVKYLESLATPVVSGNEAVEWNGINEIVYGAAGIGLFLNELYQDYQVSEALALSRKAANGLIINAVDTLNGKRWTFSPEIDRYYDNFSHGTGGIAYFLSEFFTITKDSAYLNAALKGARFLSEITNEKGYIPHHFPGGEELFYLSWCHGTPGMSRLYYSLYKNTGEERWLKQIDLATNNLMAEDLAINRTPGFWNNLSRCCGTAGVAEHFLWMYELTGEYQYLEHAEKLHRAIIKAATENESELKWVHAENRVDPDVVMAQSGLMQGSAGIGLWFLQWDAHRNGRNTIIQLPDKPTMN